MSTCTCFGLHWPIIRERNGFMRPCARWWWASEAQNMRKLTYYIRHYCDSDQLCAFVGLQCGNQNNRWLWTAVLQPQKSYIHKKFKKKTHFLIHTQLLIIHFYIHWGTLQRTKLQRTKSTTKLQRTVFINKIRMLQWTQMLQRTHRNTIGRHSTHMHMTCGAFPLWLERQSSSLL